MATENREGDMSYEADSDVKTSLSRVRMNKEYRLTHIGFSPRLQQKCCEI